MTKESSQLEQVLGQKDKELKAKMQEVETKESILKQLEEKDSHYETVLKDKKIVNDQPKVSKKQEKVLKNGQAAKQQSLVERLANKFEKLLEASDSKVADLEYTIETKEDELTQANKQVQDLQN